MGKILRCNDLMPGCRPSAMRMRPSGSQQDRRLSPHPYFILSETPEEFEGTEYGAGGGRTQRLGASVSTSMPMC